MSRYSKVLELAKKYHNESCEQDTRTKSFQSGAAEHIVEVLAQGNVEDLKMTSVRINKLLDLDLPEDENHTVFWEQFVSLRDPDFDDWDYDIVFERYKILDNEFNLLAEAEGFRIHHNGYFDEEEKESLAFMFDSICGDVCELTNSIPVDLIAGDTLFLLMDIKVKEEFRGEGLGAFLTETIFSRHQQVALKPYPLKKNVKPSKKEISALAHFYEKVATEDYKATYHYCNNKEQFMLVSSKHLKPAFPQQYKSYSCADSK